MASDDRNPRTAKASELEVKPTDRKTDTTCDLRSPWDSSQWTAVDANRATRASGTPLLPALIGRYRIERELGKGGFGIVYLATDEQLNRRVAVKVPHQRLVSRPELPQLYLSEARTVANLEHPNIVPVYDVGSSDFAACFIVSRFIEGTTLTARLLVARPPFSETAELIATVAEALHYAHVHGVVHRDIKPGNILIDAKGQPHVVDFGLALRDRDPAHTLRYGGTPAYMSPEQARGEGHHVDGRSDIFSLGVVLYEMLTGTRPFTGSSESEILEYVSSHEAKPPRQISDTLPRELERICLRALSKRIADRYTTANDLADDLRHFLASSDAESERDVVPLVAGNPTAEASPKTVVAPDGVGGVTAATPRTPAGGSNGPRVVPKGLRSFDELDADFFLDLLPGPRDREGLPDSLRFWKARLEARDADSTFSVGVCYGPSGSGKSSLFKAGLVPRLAPHVVPIFVEATHSGTEQRLLRALRRHCPSLPESLDLVFAISEIRQGWHLPAGQKICLVIDQFEQWLHANRQLQSSDLVQALRQCDGARVQGVLLVRDDFWMALTRFMWELEVPLVEGKNSAAVDLFDQRHAKNVLAAFGQAYGCLPGDGLARTESARFLDLAVKALSEDGKVIPVRLALLAEMMKSRPWTPAAIREAGGAEGIGVTFLEETFCGPSAPLEHRLLQAPARTVLHALLPQDGSELKGSTRSEEELAQAAGAARQSREFTALMTILDSELRLISPTEPVPSEPTAIQFDSNEANIRYYQLTHDYLVPTLRLWLDRKRQETRRGRAQLLIEERARQWARNRQKRFLPTTLETLQICQLTRWSKWNTDQRAMIHSAIWNLAGRLTTVCLMLVLAAALTWFVLPHPKSLEVFRDSRASTASRIAAFEKIRRDLSDPQLLELIVSSLPDETNDKVANKMLAAVEKFDLRPSNPAGMDLAGKLAEIIATRPHSSLIDQSVSKLADLPPSDLLPLLIAASRNTDEKEAARHYILPYFNEVLKRDKAHAEDVARVVEQRLMETIAAAPSKPLIVSRELEILISAVGLLAPLCSHEFKDAYSGVSHFLREHEQIENKLVLDTIVNSFTELALRGRPDEREMLALRELLHKKEDRAPFVTLAAVKAVGKLADAASLPTVIEHATNSSELNVLLQEEAINALGDFGRSAEFRAEVNRALEQVIQTLAQRVGSREARSAVLSAAIRALGRTSASPPTHLFPFLLRSDTEFAVGSAITSMLLNEPQQVERMVSEFLEWRETLSPDDLKDVDEPMNALTDFERHGGELSAMQREAACRACVMAVVKAHSAASRETRLRALKILQTLLPASPPLHVDAADSVRQQEIEQWRRWWSEHQAKFVLEHGRLIEHQPSPAGKPGSGSSPY